MPMFSSEERSRIEARVAEVEAHTAAEIVVVTVPASDPYTEVRLATAFAFGLLCAASAHWFFPELSLTEVLTLQLLAALLGWSLLRVRMLLRWLVPGGRAQRAAERCAELAFLEHAVFETQDRTGVLILLSELEHRVVMLGDRGIHAVLTGAGWQALVDHVVREIRAGRACDGLCEVIGRLGETLAQGSPVKPGDRDELPNRVREMGTGARGQRDE